MAYPARWPGRCYACGSDFDRGTPITHARRGSKRWRHATCPPEAGEPQEPETDGPAEHEEPGPAGSAGVKLDDVKAALEVLAGALTPKIDAEAIAALVRAEVAKAVAERTATVRVESPAGVRTVTGTHRLFTRLVTWLGAGEYVFLVGPPGSGKSTAAHQAAEALGYCPEGCALGRAGEDGATCERYGYISLNPQTPESRLFGFVDAHGVYRATTFRRIYEHGGVMLIDEVDNASDALLTALNTAIENGHGAFPDGTVRRHRDFRLICAANTTGDGPSRQYPERRVLSVAFKDRFAYLAWPYDEQHEKSLTLAINPEAGPWLAWVRKVREWAPSAGVPVVATARAAYRGAKLRRLGEPYPIIADATVFRGIDPDVRSKVLTACPLPE